MKGYEIVFIMDPKLGEDGQKEIVDKAKSAYAESGGQISHETGWGRRKLAYPVKKREYGIYHVLYGDRSPEAVKAVEAQFRFNDDVIKWQTIAVEDVEQEHAAFEKLRTEGSLSKQIADRGR